MNISIRLPADFAASNDEARGKRVKRLLLAAISNGVKAVPPVGRLDGSITISLTAAEEAALRARMHAERITAAQRSQWCAGLIIAYRDAQAREQAAEERLARAQTEEQQRRLWNMRLDQHEYYRQIAAAIEARKGQRIVIVGEAATGTGKTGANWRLGLDAVARGDRVIICVPTVAIMRQYAEQWDREDRVPPAAKAGVMVAPVLGRAHFVDPLDLAEACDTGSGAFDELPAKAKSAAREWLTRGCPPLYRGNARTRSTPRIPIHRLLATPGLVEDIAALLDDAGGNPELAHEVALQWERPSEENKEERARREVYYLRASRERPHDAQIVLTTHASVAWHHKLLDTGAGGILPPCELLIIDEAHQFESAVANVWGSSASIYIVRFSIQRLLDHLQDKKSRAGAIGHLRESARHLTRAMSMGRDSPGIQGIVSYASGSGAAERRDAISREIASAVADAAAPLATALRLLRKKNALFRETGPRPALERLRSYRPILTSVRAALAANNEPATPDEDNEPAPPHYVPYVHQSILVETSPVRGWPSVTAGPRHVSSRLDRIWKRARNVVLTSATLYVYPARQPGGSASFAKNILNVPDEPFGLCPPPVAPAWVFATPVVLLPAAGVAGSWRPPKEEGDGRDSNRAAWHQQLALAIKDIEASAAGGAFVLCSSYDTIDALCPLLTSGLSNAAVIAQERQGGTHKAFGDFRSVRASGRRAIWLATGGAWTGIDLTGAPQGDKRYDPHTDLMATDLVVTRLPFRMMKSSTSAWRACWDTTNMFRETAWMFAQGLGRLVRAEGLPRRRIWILDGRAGDTGGGPYAMRLFTGYVERFQDVCRFRDVVDGIRQANAVFNRRDHGFNQRLHTA